MRSTLRARHLVAPAIVVLGALLSGCSAGPVVESTRQGRIPADAPYLLAPTEGYTPALTPRQEAALSSAYRDLVESSSTANARLTAGELLVGNPELMPAVVLRAQADLIEEDYASVIAALQPLVERDSEYAAAQMVYARAAEQSGASPEALVAYGSLSERYQLALSRFSIVKPAALQILGQRVSAALQRSHMDAARANLAVMERWAPGAVGTLEAAVAVAVAQNDTARELSALRSLAAAASMSEPQTLRRARLELEIGDAGTGLRIVQDLAAASPGNPRFAAELARAKFLWRLELLPEKVKKLAREPQLQRGDLAAMIYWLFPSVRYGKAETGRIANDVLNHPHRQEIVRVANLGIMGVDSRLHRFEPDRVLSRSAAIVPILRVLGRQRPVPACLSGYNVASRMSQDLACGLAARCGLVDEESDCLPGAEATGSAAIEWTRRALDNLGAE